MNFNKKRLLCFGTSIAVIVIMVVLFLAAEKRVYADVYGNITSSSIEAKKNEIKNAQKEFDNIQSNIDNMTKQINDLKGNWLPFLLMAVIGGVVTFVYLLWMCMKLYPNYVYEGFFSMFGMLTGTISSGVLLLREIDPDLRTPASNNLVTGSSYGIIFGAPVLLLVSFAPKSESSVWMAVGLVIAYLALLLLFIFKAGNKKK